jgi:hypothetical protein
MQQPELWIGLVEVKPLDRKAYGAAGAFTYIVTWACDIEGFRKKAETIAATLDMFVADIEGAEPLGERIKVSALTEEIEDMVLARNRTQTRLSTERFIAIRLTKPELASCCAALPKGHVRSTHSWLQPKAPSSLTPEARPLTRGALPQPSGTRTMLFPPDAL